MRWRPLLLAAIILLILNSVYLLVDERAALFYVAQIFLHLPIGLGVIVLAGWVTWTRQWPSRGFVAVTLALALGTGVALVAAGNTISNRGILIAHIAVGAIAVLSVASAWSARPQDSVTGRRLLLGVIAAGLFALSRPLWPLPTGDTIVNPPLPPMSMADEAMDGSDGPFFPSAVETTDGRLIPESFFLESESCGRAGCHVDVTAQWSSSAHHFSSFNNPWYSKSIEYMQEVAGLKRPLFCAGCHDHALLFSGQMDQPMAAFQDSPAAQAGLGCVSCHAVKRVKGTMGNGGIVVDYPAMHDLATSEQPILRWIHDATLRLDPGPHRATFLRPFHELQPSEFCSSCHKVHLDEPVNAYRWVRGFNTYDNWQASGVSGQGARSFYEPAEPRTCLDCHMPQVPSGDAGANKGLIRAHNYPAANTALPTLGGDKNQLQDVKSFLEAGQLRIDIFAAGEPFDTPAPGDAEPGPFATATTFAVGMEQGAESSRGGPSLPPTPISAPLVDGSPVLIPGRTTRLDIVVRTLGLGHFFPTGTVDAQEAWLELKATDATGRVLFWSGEIGEDGIVDPSAHFYRSFMVDQHANPIDKRNAFAARAAVYVNLIPPGAADVARYLLNVPSDIEGDVTVEARIRYRKFSWWYTHFSFRGERDPSKGGSFDVGFDDGQFALAGDAALSPEVPVVTMAETRRTLGVVEQAGNAHEADAAPALDSSRGPSTSAGSAADSLRWNDYGIGLLLQGDLHGAEAAFTEVTRLAPGYADGWVNLARVHIQDGDLESASAALEMAFAVQPGFHKARFFRAMYHKATGNYPAALDDLVAVNALFPTDRVVLNQMGRVHYLNERLEAAVAAFESVLSIDPEDLMAHYNLMLCYQALGNIDMAAAHEARYQRFRADDSAQEIARRYRATDPFVNNEALPIHMHGS